MSIQFTAQTTTTIQGGNGGGEFTDAPGAPSVLVGILYDCKAFTNHVDEFPTWTIYYRFIRSLIPYYATISPDGTIGVPTPGSTHGGSADRPFATGGFALAPPGYIVTGMNVRWGVLQDGGGIAIKAFQLAFARWTGAGGIQRASTIWTPWHGGDGQLNENTFSSPSNAPLADPFNVDYCGPVAPTPSSSSGENGAVQTPSDGSCLVGLTGRAGDWLNALGAIVAIPKIVS